MPPVMMSLYRLSVEIFLMNVKVTVRRSDHSSQTLTMTFKRRPRPVSKRHHSECLVAHLHALAVRGAGASLDASHFW